MSRATFYPTAGGDCPRGAPPFRPEGYWATVKWASALVGAETRRALAAEAEIARSVPVLDDAVAKDSANGVKSSGIWAFAKGLLPEWLVPGYAEPASAESVASAVRPVSEALGNHVSDETVHVTESDRTAWDDKYTKQEVDDKITRFAAHYLTDRVDGRFVPFATHARLAEAKAQHTEENPRFFYAGAGFTPTKNDYCVVLSDETYGGKTTRYSFVGVWGEDGKWQYQYTVNDTAFSAEQWAAINSLTSVDGDGNLCFDGIPVVDSAGKLIAGLTGEDIPVSSEDATKVADAIAAKRGLTDYDVVARSISSFVWTTEDDNMRPYLPTVAPTFSDGRWHVPNGEFTEFNSPEGTGDETEVKFLESIPDAGWNNVEISVSLTWKEENDGKLARTSATEGIAKIGEGGVLTAATKSSDAEENADYRDPLDAKCYKSKFGEWTFSDGVQRTLYFSTYEGTSRWGTWPDWTGDAPPPSPGWFCFAAEDDSDLLLEEVDDSGIRTGRTATATRAVVATKGHTFVTDDVMKANGGRMTDLGDGRYEYVGALEDASTRTYPREEA